MPQRQPSAIALSTSSASDANKRKRLPVDAITQNAVRSTHCCRLSSMRIFAVSYGRLTKSSDEMSTKTSRILVLVSVLWSNFRLSFSFVDENQRFLVIVLVSMTKINLFSLTKFQFQFQSTKKTLIETTYIDMVITRISYSTLIYQWHHLQIYAVVVYKVLHYTILHQLYLFL